MVAAEPAPSFLSYAPAMHIQISGAPPQDLGAFLRTSGYFVQRAVPISDPVLPLQELVAAAKAKAPAEQVRLATAWQGRARFDEQARKRLQTFAALRELRSFAGSTGLRLWDPRLESATAMADAALLRWQAFGVTTLEPVPELVPAVQQALQEDRELLDQQGAIAEVQFLEGTALWLAQRELMAAARHFHARAASTRDAAMAERQRTLAARLDTLARQIDATLNGKRE